MAKTALHCLYCYRPLEEGNCPTLGCRQHYRDRRGPRSTVACVVCGDATPNRFLAVVPSGAEYREHDAFESRPPGAEPTPFETPPYVARCDQCEQLRYLAQAQAVAANPDVYPHIRERCAAYAVELEKELAA